MLKNMLKDCAIDRVSNSASAATTAINSSRVDMSGYDGVCFVVLLGDVTDTSVVTATGYRNSADSTSGATSTGVSATYTCGASDADNKILVVDVQNPQQQYAYCNLTRTTANAVVDGIIAIRYHGTKSPITQGSTVLASGGGRSA